MKKILMLGSAVAAATVFAGTAHADNVIWDGYGAIAAGYHSLSEPNATYADYENGELTGSGSSATPGKFDGLDLDARISVSIPLGNHLGAQVDGEFDHVVTGFPASYHEAAYKSDGNTLAVHAYWRNASSGLVGLFGQRNGASSNYGGYVGGNTDYDLGGEAQIYLGNLTLYGQAAYAASDHASNYYYNDSVGSGPAFSLQARYYPQPDWAFTLKAGYQSAHNHYSASGDDYTEEDRTKFSGWLVGARGEYRLPNSRLSLSLDGQFRTVLAKYSYSGTESEEGTDVTVDSARATLHDFRIMVGAKLNFGAKSLFERDRSGASLDPITSLFDGIATLLSSESA